MFEIVNNYSNEFVADLQQSGVVGFDIESSGLDYFTDEILLVQFILSSGNIYIIPWKDENSNILEYVFSLIKDSGKLVIGHNLKFDTNFIFSKLGIRLDNLYDTMFNEVILLAGIGRPYYSLDYLVKKYTGEEMDKDVRDKFIGAKEVTQEMLIYSALDVKYLLEIRNKQLTALEEKESLHISELEMKLLPIVAAMEYDGVLLDVDMWRELETRNEDIKNELARELLNLIFQDLNGKFNEGTALEAFELLKIPVRTKKKREMLQGISGVEFIKGTLMEEFNLNSTYQVGAALNLLGIEVPNTNEKTLRKYRGHPVVDKLLEYREYQKIATSYGDTYIDAIHPKTGRIHPDWHQLKATGRFGCSGPNMQNVVRKSDYRHCFRAREGYKLITADYSQAELRLLGAISGEPRYKEIYQQEKDLHTETAADVYNVDGEEVSEDQRQIAKNVNFSIAYLTSAYGLYYNYGIPIEEGKHFLRRHRELYPILIKFRDLAGELIWEKKISKTPYGRRRYFKGKDVYVDIKEFDRHKKSVIREGFNHIIQGGSADCIKLSMVELYYSDKYKYGIDFRILLQVHDELVIEAKDEVAKEISLYVKEVMEQNEQRFLGDIPAVVGKPKVLDYWGK